MKSNGQVDNTCIISECLNFKEESVVKNEQKNDFYNVCFVFIYCFVPNSSLTMSGKVDA